MFILQSFIRFSLMDSKALLLFTYTFKLLQFLNLFVSFLPSRPPHFLCYVCGPAFMSRCPERPEEVVKSLGTRVTGCCVLSNRSSGNQTQVFCKSSNYLELMTYVSRFQSLSFVKRLTFHSITLFFSH